MNKGVVRCFRGDARCEQTEYVIGRDLSIDPTQLQDFCTQPLNAVEQSLVLLAAVVAYADRRFRRHRGTGWTRRLRVTVPVSDPELWQQAAVDGALRSLLWYVTGDRWDFEYSSEFEPIIAAQSSLKFSNQNGVVMPFSQGLDSYLTWQDLEATSPGVGRLSVHLKSGASNAQWLRQHRKRCSDSDISLIVPISLSLGSRPEPSYRTRSFVFYVMAAFAAAKFKLSRVVIGENGVGAIGPLLVPIGDEHPHRGSFPAYTQKIAQFVNGLLGTNIRFTHPNLFHTKGQMLQRLPPSRYKDWRSTNSCVRDSRSGLGKRHCGLCCGCLLRRVALRTVGQQDSEYAWTKLENGTLGECPTDLSGRESTPNDEDIALHAIHSMECFAQFANETILDQSRIRMVARELADVGLLNFNSCLSSIASLCREHRKEWTEFQDQFPSNSLIRRFGLHACTN